MLTVIIHKILDQSHLINIIQPAASHNKIAVIGILPQLVKSLIVPTKTYLGGKIESPRISNTDSLINLFKAWPNVKFPELTHRFFKITLFIRVSISRKMLILRSPFGKLADLLFIRTIKLFITVKIRKMSLKRANPKKFTSTQLFKKRSVHLFSQRILTYFMIENPIIKMSSRKNWLETTIWRYSVLTAIWVKSLNLPTQEISPIWVEINNNNKWSLRMMSNMTYSGRNRLPTREIT